MNKKEAKTITYNGEIICLERENNRWLMMVYDTLIYLLCWIVVFVLHPSMEEMPPMSLAGLYFAVGYVAIFGLRMAFRGYKKIWRYGHIHALAREIFAGIVGSGVMLVMDVVLRKKFEFAQVPLCKWLLLQLCM